MAGALHDRACPARIVLFERGEPGRETGRVERGDWKPPDAAPDAADAARETVARAADRVRARGVDGREQNPIAGR